MPRSLKPGNSGLGYVIVTEENAKLASRVEPEPGA